MRDVTLTLSTVRRVATIITGRAATGRIVDVLVNSGAVQRNVEAGGVEG